MRRTPAERRGRDGDRLARRRHPNVELRIDVDPHTVLGDECVVPFTHDAYAQDIHADRRHLMDEGKNERPTVDHDLLAEKARAHERQFLRGSVVEPIDEVDDDHHDDDGNDEPYDQATEHSSRHIIPSRPPAAPTRACSLLWSWVCGSP